MKSKDLLQETYAALLVNKARSGLTVLGIVIGIASVIAMVSIGQGAQNSIQASIQSIGSNLVLITPGAQRGVGFGGANAGRGSAQTLTQEDATAIQQQVTTVAGVAPETTRRYQVIAGTLNTNTSVIGTVSAYPLVRNIEIEEGSFLTDDQINSLAKVAVIGPTTRDDLFGPDADPIGKTIRINRNTTFKIVGLTKAKGGSGFNNPDDAIYVPISTAQHYLSGDNFVTTISVSALDQDSMPEVQQVITDLLLSRHHISNPDSADFSILNQADIIATASTVTNTFTLLLASIASISLLVGGIGIMNMMLTTVTERTREIGLRKAIGAKKKDISRQFLVEAVMLTFFGGAMGIVLGTLLAFIVSHFIGVAASVSLQAIVLAFGVSTVIGIAFGYYPARRAASLNPIEALRYE